MENTYTALYLLKPETKFSLFGSSIIPLHICRKVSGLTPTSIVLLCFPGVSPAYVLVSLCVVLRIWFMSYEQSAIKSPGLSWDEEKEGANPSKENTKWFLIHI